MGTPNWIYSSYGVDKQNPTTMGTPGWQFADVGDANYQVKLGNFLSRLAERYRNRESIEAVSLRGYGAWAEWHHGFRFPNEASKIKALRQTIDTWSRAWEGTNKLLSLPVSVDCGDWDWISPECDTIKNQDYNTYKRKAAYDYALTLPMLTFNKDCVGDCNQQIEYRLLNESFNKKKLPLIGEFGKFYRDHKKIWQMARPIS